MKKILVLTGSPIKNGNTDKMADAFIEGARESGNEVVKFETAFKKIGGCMACNLCWSQGNACIRQDDFQELSPLLESCEALLISSPLYWFSLPAQLKGAIDRLYAYGGSGGLRPLAIKESCFFLCGNLKEKDEYQPMLNIYDMIVKYLGWKDRGIIQIGGVDEAGALEASGVLAQAKRMGREI